MKPISKKHIIVIGGGFAGLNLIRRLSKASHYNITLVDKNNYNYFTPLLYQVATSFLEPSSISYPFRKLFKKSGISFRMAGLSRIDAASNTIYIDDGSALNYDILVIAAGSKTNFFGNEGIRRHAFSLKGIDDALYLRNELISTLEKAAVEKNPAEKSRLLRIVIAGGGPTGVEVAGMLAEFKHCILGTEYPEIKKESLEIYLIDGAAQLLTPMSKHSQQEAYRKLVGLGVRIKLNVQVTFYDNETIHLSDGEVLEAKTMIWAAGVVANTIRGISENSVGKSKRLMTDAYNRINGYENIYAIGDISVQYTDERYPNGHPQLAQPAIQQGKNLARNLVRMAVGKQTKPFRYFDRGDMAIIGRTSAVADLFRHKMHLNGALGLLSWLFIHLISLVNYNNKFKTLYNWIVAYLTHDQVLRMIFRSGNRENVVHSSLKKYADENVSVLSSDEVRS
jgi:NADH dehydrogenase